MNTHTTTHEGLERVLEGADVIRQSVGPARGMRVLPVVVLTGMTAAVLVILDRAWDVLSTSGFASEWLAMWLLSVAAVMVLGKAAMAASRWLIRSERGVVAYFRRMSEMALLEQLIAFDPRMGAELRAARDRAERD